MCKPGGGPWPSAGPGRRRARRAHTGAPSCRGGSRHTRRRSRRPWLRIERCQSDTFPSDRGSCILPDSKGASGHPRAQAASEFPRTDGAAYFGRWRLPFGLRAARGSRGGSLDTSRNSLQLCCADTHIGREPEDQARFSSFTAKFGHLLTFPLVSMSGRQGSNRALPTTEGFKFVAPTKWSLI